MEARVIITNLTGLHARPAVKLAQLASKYKEVEIEVKTGDSEWVKARSAARIMKLKASYKSELIFKAEGSKAKQALEDIVSLVRRNFDEVNESTGDEESDNLETKDVSPSGGLVASAGIAFGRIFHWREHVEQKEEPKPEDNQQELLITSIEKTKTQLQYLIQRSSDLAADVISFQLALLEDELVIAGLSEIIQSGMTSKQAVTKYFSEEIDDYMSGDDYIRARVSDLKDLEKRIINNIDGIERKLLMEQNAVVVAKDIKPTEFLELEQYHPAAIILANGSKNAHVSLLARSAKIPCLVQYNDIDNLKEGTLVIVKAEGEQAVVNDKPSEDEIELLKNILEQKRKSAQELNKFLLKPAITSTKEKLNVLVNLDSLSQLEQTKSDFVDGIGLVRTELLFDKLEDEETQYQAYSKILKWAKGKPVTIRTLDAGADKPIAGLSQDKENNPFLGVRGIRLSLANVDIFRTQVRALLRAAIHGPLKVLLPMVSTASELDKVREIMKEEYDYLNKMSIPSKLVPLGIMVEVPAAALCIDSFKADFYSIGSNDLTQYVMAASRDNSSLEYLLQPLSEAVKELIRLVVGYCEEQEIELSICGEIASQPSEISMLNNLGLKSFSVSIGQIAAVKEAITKL